MALAGPRKGSPCAVSFGPFCDVKNRRRSRRVFNTPPSHGPWADEFVICGAGSGTKRLLRPYYDDRVICRKSL